MTLYPMKDLLIDAYRNHYAIPAFNFENFDVLAGIFVGAEASRSPLIIQITQPALEFLGVEQVVAVVSLEAKRRKVPTALHLDHGDNLAMIQTAINSGFTSVMIDGSEKPFAENVAVTKEVIQLARPKGVTVEALIGHVGTAVNMPQERDTMGTPLLTNPQDALIFHEQTTIDVLAVAVGSIHGVKSKGVHLDLPRLAEIYQQVTIPLVLHGSSGVVYEDLCAAIKLGITKTNIETALRVIFRQSLEQLLSEKPQEVKPRNIMGAVRKATQDYVMEQQHILQSSGKSHHFYAS